MTNDFTAKRDEHRWTYGAIIDMEAAAHAEDAERAQLAEWQQRHADTPVSRYTRPGTWVLDVYRNADHVEALAENDRRTPPANPFSADYTQPLTDFERRCGVLPPANRVTDPATPTTTAGRPMTDDEREITFPASICSDTAPHVKHRIAGTWREECPGVDAADVQRQGWVDAVMSHEGMTVRQAERAVRDEAHAEALRNRVTGTCPAGASCTGAAFPGHPAHAVRTDADALRDTANHHQGSRVHAADADHGRQLRRAGLTGPRGGLTRRGSIVAEGLRNAALDDAFGPL